VSMLYVKFLMTASPGRTVGWVPGKLGDGQLQLSNGRSERGTTVNVPATDTKWNSRPLHNAASDRRGHQVP